MRLSRAVFAVLFVAGCKEAAKPTSPAPKPTEPIPKKQADLKDPNTCKDCHETVFAEWQGSIHASANVDPIFLGIRKLRSKKETDLEKKCGTCHAPTGGNRGVTCFACHGTASVAADKRGAGAMSYTDDRVLYGPSKPKGMKLPVHGTADPPPHMTDGSSLCMACHADLANPNGVPLCQTATEWKAAAPDETCVGCHMKETAGTSGAVSTKPKHRSHRFAGPRRLWTEKPAAVAKLGMVGVTAAFERGKLVVELKNETGHAFPSGFPGRMAKLVVRGGDFEKSFVLAKKHVDEAGKPTIAAYATKIAKDTRLEPKETRRITVKIPKKVKKVDVRLVHFLLPPPLADKIELSGPEREPRMLAEVSVERK